MNWNVFFEIVTWFVTCLAGLGVIFSFASWLEDVNNAGIILIVMLCVTILGAATIGGMGWGG